MPWGAAIGAVAGLAGSAIGAGAAGDASAAQIQASQAALAQQQQMYQQQQQNLAPFLQGGTAANGMLLNELGLQNPAAYAASAYSDNLESSAAFRAVTDPIYAQYGATPAYLQTGSNSGQDSNIAANMAARQAWQDSQGPQTAANTPGFGSLTAPITMDTIKADPVYASGLDFGLNQGTKSLNNAALANGSYDSGATMQALNRYAQDYGTTKAQAGASDIQSNRAQQYSFLSGAANEGLSAAGAANASSANNASAQSGLLTGIGNANAAGIVGGANAYSGLGSSLGNLYNNAQSNSLLQNLYGSNGNGANYGGAGQDGYATGMSDIYSQLYASAT